MFSREFSEISKNTSFTEDLWLTASGCSNAETSGKSENSHDDWWFLQLFNDLLDLISITRANVIDMNITRNILLI